MLWRKDVCSILRFLVEEVTRDCVLEKKLIGLVEDFVVKDTVDCCRRFVESFCGDFWRFLDDSEVIVIVNNKLLVELMIAIAVLAEDILFLALSFNCFVVFSSLSWFGTPSVLLSFLRLFGNLKLVVLGYGTS